VPGLPHHGRVEVGLVLEVVVEGGLADARLVRDPGERGGLVALEGELARRRGQETLPSVRIEPFESYERQVCPRSPF